MITISLRNVCNHVVEKGHVEANDVRRLQREIFPDGLISRDEADMLIALDRTVAAADSSWTDFLVASLVDFVVWTSRSTGYVDQETAQWLVASLSCGEGPTEAALWAAFEIVKEAQQVDQLLLAFLMRATQGRSRVAREDAAADLVA